MKRRSFLAPAATSFAALLAASSLGIATEVLADSGPTVRTAVVSDSDASAPWFVIERGESSPLQASWHSSHSSHSSHGSHSSHSSHGSGW